MTEKTRLDWTRGQTLGVLLALKKEADARLELAADYPDHSEMYRKKADALNQLRRAIRDIVKGGPDAVGTIEIHFVRPE